MEYLISIFLFSVLVLIFWALGRKLLGLFGFAPAGAIENFVFSFGVGFALVAYLVLFLGVFKILYAPVAGVLLLALALTSLPEIRKCLSDISGMLRGGNGSRFSLTDKILLCMLCAAGVMTLFGALSPSYSNDSMVYHLTDAKYFAGHHMVGIIPENSTNSLWPYLVEMHYTLALLFGLFPLAGLFHFSLAAMTALGVYAFAKRFFSGRAGLFAAVIFFLTPVVFTEATQTYVDLGSAFYAFMAFYAFTLYFGTRSPKWAALTGVMCGLGMSVKYFAIIVPMILGVWMLSDLVWGMGRGAWDRAQGAKRRARSTDGVFAMLFFCLFTFAFSFPWYLRQWAVMGNPFFPFFAGVFGGGALDPHVVELISEGSIRESQGMMVDLKNFLTLPWRMTMFPDKFGGEQIGPLFLAVIPGAVLLRKADAGIKRVFIFAFAYICIWFVQYQHMRFFLPVVPFLAVIAAYILDKVADGKKAADIIIRSVVIVLLTISPAIAFYRNFDSAKVVLGLESEHDYLAANERSFEVSEFINSGLPDGAKIMAVNEAHTFFIDKPYKRELYWWIFTRYDEKYSSGDEVVSSMRADGFTHILYARCQDDDKALGTAFSLPELMKDGTFRDRYLKPVYTVKPRSRNANGVEYGVYEIK